MSDDDPEFNALWRRFEPEVRRTGGRIDLQFPAGGSQRTITSVVRVPPALAQFIAGALTKLRLAFPEHYHYPETDFHFTVLDCTKLRSDDVERLRYSGPDPEPISTLREIFKDFPPFAVQLVGLGVFPTTVFIKVRDLGSGVRKVRQAARKILDVPATEPILPPFVNILRFRERVRGELLDAISEQRDTYFGSFTVAEVQLVVTDKLLSTPNTRLLEVFRLQNGP